MAVVLVVLRECLALLNGSELSFLLAIKCNLLLYLPKVLYASKVIGNVMGIA